LVSADTATCADCLRELADPADRRFGYPFINCTNCGPRFTIVRDVPYDRPLTTMADFAMCERCAAEYHDPADRRFHAQPTCCPACGPRLTVLDQAGNVGSGEPVARTAELLREGQVLAIKGLGGYHLAADAACEQAVAALRAGKHREDKPFAVMAADLAAARQLCEVDSVAAELLASKGRPIVLLTRRPDADIAASAAPGNRSLGIMLPYTPLHHLLLQAVGRPIVLTSGNVSDEPILFRDGDALARLGGIADAFLVHDRAIHIRTDDSVARVFGGRPMLIRRSRGYVPEPISVTSVFPRATLACGAELKNTFCLARDRHAVVSQHIGDLENAETLRSFTEGIEHFRRLFDIDPQVVAHDLHPEYLSTKYAMELADEGLSLQGVQHHHAHIASCLADNGIGTALESGGPVIGVAFDGTGYGPDGTIWGGEFLVADLAGFERVGHLAPVPMPGGAAAIRQPWRMAAAYLGEAGPDDLVRRNQEAWPTIVAMARKGINSPLTSSAGRLFDAAAAILGVRDAINYEGQAAVELEQLADPTQRGAYPAGIEAGPPFRINGADLLAAVVEDLAAGTPRPVIAARFHHGVAALIEAGCLLARDRHGLGTVALSGGVFQNMLLLHAVVARLEAAGFRVLVHSRVPCNDGGISLGQAVVAGARDRLGLLGPKQIRGPSRSGALADPGQRIADQQVHDPGAAERGLQLDEPRQFVPHVPDDRGLLAERVAAQRGERMIGLLARYDRDQTAFAGHVHRVDPQQLASTAYLGPDRDLVLADQHADFCRLGDLVEDRGHAAPGRVAHRPDAGHRVQQARHQPVQRRGIGGDVRLDVELAAGQHDGDAMIADGPGHDDGVARPGPRRTEDHVPLDEADARGVDVAAVGLALLDHLGIPGDDAHAGRGGRGSHRLGDPLQVRDGEAFLQDEPGRQVERGGTGHGQVVDRAVYRQVADVAAGEEQRLDHIGIGGQRQPGPVDGQLGRVLEGLEQRVAERVEEDRLDQGLGRLAAGAVRHRDAFFPDPGATPPGAVDPVQDLLLRVGQRQLAPARRVSFQPVEPFVLLVLVQGLIDPARSGAHDRLTCASATRWRFIRP
jgi:hydrogenase maturation protein HypF